MYIFDVERTLTHAHKSIFPHIESVLPYAVFTTYAMLPRAHAGKNKPERKKMSPINSPHGRSEYPSASIKTEGNLKKGKINLPFDTVGHVKKIVQPKKKKQTPTTH